MYYLFSITLLGSILYLDMEPKNRIKEDIIKKGDKFSIDNKHLSDYINVLENLNILIIQHLKTVVKLPSRLIALTNGSASIC